MKIYRFDAFEKLQTNSDKLSIDNNWFDKATKEELDRILIAYNDGQGDTNCYTYDDIVDIISGSEEEENGKIVPFNISKLTPVQIIQKFYDEVVLDGNMVDAVYFDGKKYLKIQWK